MPLDLANATVVIDSPVAGTVTEALLQGCDSVLGQNHCLPGALGSFDSRGNWSAEVQPVDTTGLVVRITLYRGHKDQGPYLERTVSYGANNAADQRERATGIVIAAGIVSAMSLASDPDKDSPPAATVGSTESQSRSSSSRPTPAQNRSLGIHLDALAALEQGANHAAPLLGGRLRAWLSPSFLPLRGGLTLRYAYASPDYTLQRFGAELGLALHAKRLPWLEPRLAALVVRNQLTAEDAAAERTESAVVYRYGALVGLDLLWPLEGPWTVLLGAELTFLGQTYDLTVTGRATGSESLLGYGLVLGLRFGKN